MLTIGRISQNDILCDWLGFPYDVLMTNEKPASANVTQQHDWRVLIVEDEYFLADDLARGFGKEGISIVGPVPSVDRAMALVAQKQINLAVLDIALDGDKVYDVADALMAQEVPVLFVTGYDRDAIPDRYANVPICQKPVGADDVIKALRRIISE